MSVAQCTRAANPMPNASRALVATILLISLYTASRAADLLRQDLAFTAVQTEVSFWGRGDYQPARPVRTDLGRRLDTLLADSPAQPDYLTVAASYFAWQAFWAETLELEQDYSRRALRAQYTAQQSRPAYRRGWVIMLGYAARDGGAPEQMALARQRVSALEPGFVPARLGGPARY